MVVVRDIPEEKGTPKHTRLQGDLHRMGAIYEDMRRLSVERRRGLYIDRSQGIPGRVIVIHQIEKK